MNEPEVVFCELNLKENDTFLDLGCGAGDYALKASEIVGSTGIVYALDKSAESIDHLTHRQKTHHISNITPMVADITHCIPLDDHSIDVCLIATVLHIPVIKENIKTICIELHRILKPEGRLVVIDCHKKDLTVGPPVEMRISSEEMVDLLTQYNFKMLREIDLGFNYMLQFRAC